MKQVSEIAGLQVHTLVGKTVFGETNVTTFLARNGEEAIKLAKEFWAKEFPSSNLPGRFSITKSFLIVED